MRTEVVLVHLVVTRFTIGSAGEVKAHSRILVRASTFQHALASVRKPLPHTDIRRDLRTVGFPGRSFEGVAQAKIQGQVRFYAERILSIKFKRICTPAALHRS